MNLPSGWTWCQEQEELARESGRYKHLLIDWLEQAVDETAARAVAHTNPNDWPRARLKARQELYRSLGLDPLPSRETITPPCLVGIVERDGYIIERLVLEPRPNFLMPVHLYLPRNAHFPVPAILYAPGHWMIYGKTEPDIQHCCISLAKLGYAVLVFDPIGQGERGATFEDHARRELLLLGLSQEGLMAWESMRAIDYLLTRPEINGNRIGMTGASGGGLNTIYTCAADERIAVSVPVCYVTSFGRFFRAMRGLNWNNQDDLCNQVPNVIRYADMAGLCGLIHPRPLLIINGTLDPQFPVDGAQAVVDQVQAIYDQVGPERLRLTAIDADHGYDQAMREAAYGWFHRWLQGEGDGSPVAEPPHQTEPPDSEKMKCFPGTASIRSYPAIRALARTYSRTMTQTPDLASMNWESWKATLRQKVVDCLGGLAEATVSGRIESRSDSRPGLERHLIEPEAGMVVPAFVAKPESRQPNRVVIYLSDEGKLSGFGPELLSIVASKGGLAMAIDPRGMGEIAPLPPPRQTVATLDGKLDYRETQTGDTLEFEAATDALMLGRSLFGQQVSDLLQSIDYARQLTPHAAVAVVGSGPSCSLLALYAGVLSDQVAAVVADGLLPSYKLLVEEEERIFPITAFVFGILRVADVPQLAGAILPRSLLVTRPIGARLQAIDPAEAGHHLNWANAAYQQHGVAVPIVLESAAVQTMADFALGKQV